jgi:HprK-related kinase A
VVIELSTRWFEARFRMLSYEFRIRSNVVRVEDVVPRLFAPFTFSGNGHSGLPTYKLTDRGEGVERRYRLDVDGSKIQEVVSPGSMLDWVIADSCRRAVASAGDVLAIHAGVVAIDNRAAVFPAPPDAGKTTLTAGLTRAGFAFLSDEVAVIDPGTRLVHPFPRPVLMDPGSVDVLEGLRETLPPAYEAFRRSRYHLAPDDLRPGALGGPCEIGYVIAPAYRRGATTTLEPISRAETLMHLARNAFNLERFGGRGFATLADVVETCRGFRLSIGDLTAAVALVSDLLSSNGSG